MPEHSEEGNTKTLINIDDLWEYKRLSAWFVFVSTNMVFSKKEEKENQRLQTLKNTVALVVPVERIYIKVTAGQLILWICVLLPREKHSLPAVLQNIPDVTSGSLPIHNVLHVDCMEKPDSTRMSWATGKLRT